MKVTISKLAIILALLGVFAFAATHPLAEKETYEVTEEDLK